MVRRSTPLINGSRRPVLITHCEMVSDISLVPPDVSGLTFRGCPGTLTSWLAGVSANWSKWRWLKIRFVYVPTTSTNTSGSVALGLMYDVTDRAPRLINDMSSLEGFTTGPVWSGSAGAGAIASPQSKIPSDAIAVDVDTTRFKNPWYPWTAENTVARMLALDFPQNYIANDAVPFSVRVLTDGSQTTTTKVGELYVVYTIELIEPIPAHDQDSSPDLRGPSPSKETEKAKEVET